MRLKFAVLLLCCILSIVTYYPALLHPLTPDCPSHNTKVIGQMPFCFPPLPLLISLLSIQILFNPPFSRNPESGHEMT